MDSISLTLISKVLDNLALRQSYSAQNIANANTPGYQPVRISFEAQLQKTFPLGIDKINSLKPDISHIFTNGNEAMVRLDQELAIAGQTAMRYSALIDVLGRQFSLSRSVINGGR